ncbi:MAG: DUF4388 domain-containing protein [Mastigocoleus sp. MO_167.B18]|nr:DUF4388 domain-containing protein [Mastigocoleus sp. MO_167.B18]
MQGNLNEIDIRSLLKLIELGQRSGFLWVETDNNTGKINSYYQIQEEKSQWLIFFDNGQIIYAVEGQSDTSKIDDYLRYYRIKDWQNRIELASLSSSVIPEYGYLWALLEQKIITPNQARNIIYSLVSDVLFDLFSLHQGSFSFCNALVLEPQVTTFEISSLTSEISQQTLDWKKLYPYIQSPRQFPILTDIEKLSSNLPQPTVNKLKHWADGQTSLRQLARCLNKDTVTVAKAIYPYMQDNLVRMVYSNTRKLSIQHQPNQKNRIVCIDDVVNTAKSIESTLHAGGYDAIAITSPLEAIGQIFNIKPDLIFCAFTMSDLDGWEICAMLRNSSTFRKVPIIILGTSCKFIDRMRAKMIGATDYLSKPFQNHELLVLVDKYLQSQPAFK